MSAIRLSRRELPRALRRPTLALALGLSSFTFISAARAAPNDEVPNDEAPGPGESAETPGDPWGDGKNAVQVGPLTLRFLLQTRYTATFAAPSTNPEPGYPLREEILVEEGDGWALNRLFMRIGVEPTEHIGFKTILDFAKLIDGNPRNVVKQAFVTLRILPSRIEVAAGLFKLPFSILELDPVARYEFAELGAANDLVKDLGFAGRDVGLQLVVAPLPKRKLLKLQLGVFRGHAYDEHDRVVGAAGGRIESRPFKGLRAGVDGVLHPGPFLYRRPWNNSRRDVVPEPVDPFFPTAKRWGAGKALSADLTFERYGITVRTEAMMGDRVDLDRRYGAETFLAAWATASYRFRLGPIKLMPAARVEWLDADREHARGTQRTLGAALGVLFSKQTRVLLDWARTDVEPGTIRIDQPRPLQAVPYRELPNTRLVAQLQLEL